MFEEARFTESDSHHRTAEIYTPSMTPAAALQTPVDDTPVDVTPIETPNETPNKTPVDETPVDQTPVDATPVHMFRRIDSDNDSTTPVISDTEQTPKFDNTPNDTPTGTPIGLPRKFKSPDYSQLLFESPSTLNSTQYFEDEQKFRLANDTDVKQSFANAKKPLFFCNQQVFATAFGAIKESAKFYPEKEIYRCNLLPFSLHATEKCRLPRVSSHLAHFFNNQSGTEIYESLLRHAQIYPIKNPFTSVTNILWTCDKDLYNKILSTTSKGLKELIHDKRVFLTKKFDCVNLCFAAMAILNLKSIDENESLFWSTFQKLLQERYKIFTPEEGLTDKTLSINKYCTNLWFSIVQNSDAHREARKLQYIHKKRRLH